MFEDVICENSIKDVGAIKAKNLYTIKTKLFTEHDC